MDLREAGIGLVLMLALTCGSMITYIKVKDSLSIHTQKLQAALVLEENSNKNMENVDE